MAELTNLPPWLLRDMGFEKYVAPRLPTTPYQWR